MSIWRQVARGLRALTNRSRTDDDVAAEVGHYLEELILSGEAAGLTREEARLQAERTMQGSDHVRETVRSYGWENVAETTLQDLRFAVRRLRATPSFTIVALLTLAVGIGGTTAIFSAVDAILFEPLPYRDSDRIAVVQEIRSDDSPLPGTFGMYSALAMRTRAFESLSVYRSWQPTMNAERPERLEGQRVTSGYFSVLGVRPALGRLFDASEDVAGGPNVVVISDAMWHRQFSGDPGIVGSRIRLNDTEFTVIGVMPADFSNVLLPTVEVWGPLQYGLSEGRAWGHHLSTMGRLRKGTSREAAAAEMNEIGHATIAEQKPDTYADDVRWTVPLLQQELTSSVRPALLAVLTAVALVLVIACVNVINLLLARGLQRRSELALRGALGATRGRMVRQLVTESLVLSFASAALGMFIASAGVRFLVALAPPDLPRLDAVRVSTAGYLLALGLTTFIGILFGLLPALQRGGNENQALQHASRRTAGPTHHAARHALVIAEVALALVLLVSSGLLLRSLQRLFAQPTGFDASGVLTMQIWPTSQRFEDDSTTFLFYDQVLEAVRHVPGVQAAGLTSQLPLTGDLDQYGIHFVQPTAMRDDEDRTGLRYAVSPSYLAAMRIPLRSGRLFNEYDRAGAPLVALINETFASRAFPDGGAVGMQLRMGAFDGPVYTIVGVVGDVKQQSLAISQQHAVYIPRDQSPFADRILSLVVRTQLAPMSLSADVRRAVWSVDRDQAVVRLTTMQKLVAQAGAQRRFSLVLFEGFALMALLLAAAGIYGVVSGHVSERVREFGVRSALGATRRSIVGMVLRQGLKLTLAGVLVGLAGAAAAAQLLRSMLFNVSELDPATYAAVVLLLAVVSLAACCLPAARAARIDPATTLRLD